MLKFIKRFAADQSGATTTEYSLIVGLMAMAVVGCVASFGLQASPF